MHNTFLLVDIPAKSEVPFSVSSPVFVLSLVSSTCIYLTVTLFSSAKLHAAMITGRPNIQSKHMECYYYDLITSHTQNILQP